MCVFVCVCVCVCVCTAKAVTLGHLMRMMAFSRRQYHSAIDNNNASHSNKSKTYDNYRVKTCDKYSDNIHQKKK